MEEDLPETPPASRWKKRRIFGAVALVFFVLLAIAWWQRTGIADRFVRDYLQKNGVRARYDIEDIGVRTQRIANVVIGDPAAPDLTAKQVELDFAIGFGQPRLRAIRASGVRLRGRLVDGKLYFGELDKLRDMESREPLALPAINLGLTDGLLSLATPWGGIGIAAQGRGNLRNRFDGRLVARSRRLAAGGCSARLVQYDGRVRIRNARPEFDGPLAAASGECSAQGIAVTAPAIAGKIQFTERFDRWIGDVAVRARNARRGDVRAEGVAANIAFNGGPRRTAYQLSLDRAAVQTPQAVVRALSANAEGTVGFAGADMSFSARGDGRIAGAAIAQALLPAMGGLVSGTRNTPIGPVVARLDPALRGALRDLDATFDFDLAVAPDTTKVAVDRFFARSDSGLILRQQAPLALVNGELTGPVLLTMNGGDLPGGRLALRPQRGGWAGTVNLDPYSAPGGSISIPQLSFTGGGNSWRFSGQATLSGPLLGGTVTGLGFPIEASVNGNRLSMMPACTNIRYGGLKTGALALPGGALRACPQRGSILQADDRGVRFALTIPELGLTGRLGNAALRASGKNVQFDLATGFAASGVAVALGSGESASRFTIDRLAGRMDSAGVRGTISGGAGQIGTVPLLISQAAGDWRWQDGVLGLDSTLFVSDAAEVDRFNPMRVPDLQVRLADNVISAIGNLVEPESGVTVADVQIRHNLGSSSGDALLSVDGLRFDDRLQPERITPLTLGSIANVSGVVSGDGRIAWDANGVTSSGRFTVAPTNLAAAFGPVEGVATEIVFTDLIGMTTEAGQIARVKSLNPGIPVLDGVVRYQLLPDQRVRIEEGRWPFHGGELILEPTILDFDVEAERKLTFRIIGLDAEKFLADYEFDNMRVSGIFDGVLPMVFNQEGGRIVEGRLVSRPGGGEVSYLGELTYEDMGIFANFAFQALRSLRFNEMRVGMNGRLDGQIITEISFDGLQQGSLARRNYITNQIAKLPIKFNVRIEAEFLKLIGSLRGLYDAEYALQQGRDLIEAQGIPGQKDEAERKPEPGATAK